MGDFMSGGLIIGGDTSGSVALVPAAIAGSTTVTIAAQSGTLNVGGPAFSVYTTDSSGYLANSSATKIRFNAENFDTNNCFDTSTYSFTPTAAGYYNFTCKILNNFGSGGQLITYLYKNGGGIAEFSQVSNTQQGMGMATSFLAYANGTTDYFEIYYYQDKGGSLSVYTGQSQTFWTGFLARTA